MGIPVLFFVRVPNDFPCHYIRNNAFDASQKTTEYLIKKGHKVLAHIKGPVNLRTSRERAEGFQSALASHNIKINPAYIVTTDFSQAGNENAVKKILSLAKKPTAIVAFNDLVALDAIEYIKKKDKSLLSQIEFSGFGNNRLLRYMDYPLSATVEEHPYNMGVEAINILLQLIKADNEPSEYLQIVHPCELQIYR
jgi:LacI family transcriptional regulator